jgi:hypothetical protein
MYDNLVTFGSSLLLFFIFRPLFINILLSGSFVSGWVAGSSVFSFLAACGAFSDTFAAGALFTLNAFFV